MGEYPRPRTVVYVKPAECGRWRVRVAQPGVKPVSVMSAPSRSEADAYARGLAIKYGWTFDSAASGGEA